jgi:hypothetical protein
VFVQRPSAPHGDRFRPAGGQIVPARWLCGAGATADASFAPFGDERSFRLLGIRFDPKTNRFPSGEIKPVDVSLNVTCSSPVPSRLIAKMSKPRPFDLDVRRKDDALAVGMWCGAKFGPPSFVTCRSCCRGSSRKLQRRRPPTLPSGVLIVGQLLCVGNRAPSEHNLFSVGQTTGRHPTDDL